MLTELDRRILTRACDLCWQDKPKPNMFSCNWPFDFQNPTFSAADDWEMVRVKVVMPHGIDFVQYNFANWCEDASLIDDDDNVCFSDMVLFVDWIMGHSSEERNQTAANFIRARPDLFPWVKEMEA